MVIRLRGDRRRDQNKFTSVRMEEPAEDAAVHPCVLVIDGREREPADDGHHGVPKGNGPPYEGRAVGQRVA